MFNKINKKILSILTVTGVLISSLSVGLYFYFNVSKYETISLKGLNEIDNTEIIFFDLQKKDVSYDILNPLVNNTGYLLTRFFVLDNKPYLVQTILNNNYTKISTWDNLNLLLDDDPTIEIEISQDNLNIMIDNLMLNIQFSKKIPIKINSNKNYNVIDYIIDKPFTDSIFLFLKNINNPSITELSINNTNIDIIKIPPSDIDPKCLLELSYQAMISGNNLVKVGICNGYKSIGIPGTNFENKEDIIANIRGALNDNYKTGFNNLKNFDFQQYDFCGGYSLGGAIAKFMSLNNYCKNIITFGTPLTFEYNKQIPIIQYINTIDDNDGCCDRTWFGGCKKKGMFLTDPVTLILKGNHENPTYIGNKNNNECIGNFAYTVWKQKFNLHLISTYEKNII